MRRLEDIFQKESVNFQGIEAPFYLIGLLSAFENRYQATADKFFEEISWKQFFAIICINLFDDAPSLKQLAELMGSSHQNVKQILNKLESKGFIQFIPDEKDKRMQRIVLMQRTRDFCNKSDESSNQIMEKIFEGISPEYIRITIQTLTQMADNLGKVEEMFQ